MIKVNSIAIENLRGIKRFSHEIGDNNLVIHGPNGSGKSGVIDAIEFALTGEICRLSGTGTSQITLGSHAPHVDYRDNKRSAVAKIVLTNTLTGNVFTIERNVDKAKQPQITPDNEEGQEILGFLIKHPEFSLSRREILKFIVAEPCQRSKEVQALLKLDEIERLRKNLKKLNSEVSRGHKSASQTLGQVRNDLLRHFEIGEIKKQDILQKANEARSVLGLELITVFEANTQLSIGLGDSNQNKKRTIDKKTLCARIKLLLEQLNSATIKNSLEDAVKNLAELKDNPTLLHDINKSTFYDEGIKLITDNSSCPFCDKPYAFEELVRHIQSKIELNKRAIILKTSINNGESTLKSDYSRLLDEIKEIKRDAAALGLNNEVEQLITLLEKIRVDQSQLDFTLKHQESVLDIFQDPYSKFDNKVMGVLKHIQEAANKIPDAFAEDKARQFLIIADDKMDRYKNAKKQETLFEERTKTTASLLSEFEAISEQILGALYKKVEHDFSHFYIRLNNDDEKDFSAQLTPDKGSLGLAVDFYGRGVFPPNAFHSEGHQDGMGLCLYLALARRIMGEKFTFCLLDDVLISVDTNHRRAFCSLLKSEFPKTQFIITTHDEVWKMQLISEKVVLSNQVVSFRSWSVDTGPACFNPKYTLEALKEQIENKNIPEAASILRHYLEFTMRELSVKLRAKLEAKDNNSRELGELSDAVISRYKELLNKTKDAANSWNQKESVVKAVSLQNEFNKATQALSAERWSLNPMVHYNEWANFNHTEFEQLRKAFFTLLKQFKCSACSKWIYVSPSKGNIKEVRCDCNKFQLNLNKKK